MQKCKGSCSRKLSNNAKKSSFIPITHVIFDLDGVILDSEWIYKSAYQKMIEDYGLEFNNSMYKLVSGRTTPNLAQFTKKTYNLINVSTEEIIEKYRNYTKLNMDKLELIPGVEKLIEKFYKNKIPLAIATSSARESFQIKMKNYENTILKYFNHIVCGNDPEVINGKPDPDIYLIAARRFFENPPQELKKCLVFEDSENGMNAALAAGMQVVLIPNHFFVQDENEIWRKATIKIDKFDQFEPELFGLKLED